MTRFLLEFDEVLSRDVLLLVYDQNRRLYQWTRMNVELLPSYFRLLPCTIYDLSMLALVPDTSNASRNYNSIIITTNINKKTQ